MGEKKVGGYLFRSYVACHPPLHVHILKDGKEIGKFDITHQQLLIKRTKKKLKVSKTSKLGRALKAAEYLL